MAKFEFKLPDIGEGVAEGEVVSWYVTVGDRVKEDQPLVDVMTDKATVQIGSPRNGKVSELRVSPGETAKVGEVLVVIEVASGRPSVRPRRNAGAHQNTSMPPRPSVDKEDSRDNSALSRAHSNFEAGAPTASSPHEGGRDEKDVATAVGDIKESLPGAAAFLASVDRAASPAYEANTPPARVRATPATRKLARELGIDLNTVAATGSEGRVTSADVRSAQAAEAVDTGTVLGAKASSRPGQEVDPERRFAAPSRGDQRIPFVGIRKAIAERMEQSTRTAAHFTFVEECEVTRLSQLRERMGKIASESGAKLTFLPFIAKAVCAALRGYPVLNSKLDEARREIAISGAIHLGIAVATDHGVVVPVLRHADQLGLLEIASEIRRLSEGARAGTLRRNELSGSTFTLTSLGRKGGLLATPVLNFPEVGILGVHRIKERPVVRDGEIVVGKVMHLSLSFDHRVVDGDIGASFAYAIIDLLEEPERLFL